MSAFGQEQSFDHTVSANKNCLRQEVRRRIAEWGLWQMQATYGNVRAQVPDIELIAYDPVRGEFVDTRSGEAFSRTH
jgi:hypothetical protein